MTPPIPYQPINSPLMLLPPNNLNDNLKTSNLIK